MENVFINLGDDFQIGGGDSFTIGEDNLLSESETLVGPQGPPGPAGPKGDPGVPGQDGVSPTITVGTTSTGLPGTEANVVNSGTSSNVVLDFVIPSGVQGSQGIQGEQGLPGEDGEAATITVGSVTTVDYEYPATVNNSGTTSAAILDFNIPRGVPGQDGQDGQDGAPGADGQAATITVGSTTTGNAGTNASVTNSGTSSAAVLDFVIPRGDTGATGPQGPSGADGRDGSNGADGFSPIATVTQDTGSATISITDANGTTTATVYDGATGATGPQGPAGPNSISALYVSAGNNSSNITVSGETEIQTITLSSGTWRICWGMRFSESFSGVRYISCGIKLNNTTEMSQASNISPDIQYGSGRLIVAMSYEKTLTSTTTVKSFIDNTPIGGSGTVSSNSAYLYALKVS